MCAGGEEPLQRAPASEAGTLAAEGADNISSQHAVAIHLPLRVLAVQIQPQNRQHKRASLVCCKVPMQHP
jgi:hypothetical protein